MLIDGSFTNIFKSPLHNSFTDTTDIFSFGSGHICVVYSKGKCFVFFVFTNFSVNFSIIINSVKLSVVFFVILLTTDKSGTFLTLDKYIAPEALSVPILLSINNIFDKVIKSLLPDLTLVIHSFSLILSKYIFALLYNFIRLSKLYLF